LTWCRKFEVVAIEPHAGMRATLVQKHLGLNVKVLDGDAGHMSVDDEWADAVVAAQVSFRHELLV
jgi:hypothetical protein